MTLREKVARAICAAECRGDPHVCDMDDHGSHCKPEVCSLWRNYRNGADAALAVIQEEARKTDTANCPRCGFAVGLVGACMAEGCPCPLLAASPLAEGNGDG